MTGSPLTRSLAGRLLLAVGLPTLALALGGILWLRHEASVAAPGLDPAFRLAILGLVLVAALMAAVQVAAVRVLVEQPLQRLAAAMRRARAGDFLHRVEVRGAGEVADLARQFNETLAAITDLHAARIDDAASLAAMQRELALARELEAKVRELEILHRLAAALAATLDVDALCGRVAALAAERIPGTAFALLLAEEATGELVVRSVAALDDGAVGTRIDLRGGLAGRALAAGRAVEAAAPGELLLPGARGPLGAALGVPMIHRGAPLGVILYGRADRGRFEPGEVRLVESAASQVAAAVDGARLHQRMVRLSQTDTLTGVENRRQLFARLELERERAARFGEPFALLLVDVDRFRELNEAVGHAAGDAVLREVAAVLSREARAADRVARYGGEEFAVLLARASPGEALEAADRLRRAIGETAFDAAPTGRVTVSVGGACFPADARDLATLVDCADAALFAAKRAGRDATRLHAAGMRAQPGRRRDVSTTGAA